MDHSYFSLSYSQTGAFSRLVNDYTENRLHSAFYRYSPNASGVAAAIAARPAHPVNRALLVAALEQQYGTLETTDEVKASIAALADEQTFTVTTAHQPNLMTGYLYFVYKILHAIKLAAALEAQHPDKRFVPVYYMGSEDADLDELGTFRFRGDRYRWDGAGQQGAVGRMDTASLKPLLNDLFRFFGPAGCNCDELHEMVSHAYLGHRTIGEATRYLVNALFGRYGLVVLNPDDAALKAAFIPVMQDELLNGVAHGIINTQTERLEQHYKSQMFPRPINLFYLQHGLRERIERQGDRWVVLNTDISFGREELLAELNTHPERFSPNVALRGLFQETILPNVAFIGGGAEVAYWLQLMPVFDHYKVFYPALVLRQSVLWIDAAGAAKRRQAGLTIEELFLPLQALQHQYVTSHATSRLTLDEQRAALQQLMAATESATTAVDPTLGKAAKAATEKMKYQFAVLEKKMLRAEKRKMDVQLDRIARAKNHLFPNGNLQERTDNFLEYYLENGPAFFDILLSGIEPLGTKFLVAEERKGEP